MSAGRPVVEARKLTKRFPGQVALDAVDLAVMPGEIHGLVGENGSGKSTLIKCLAGYHAIDGGAIVVGGEEVAGHSPTRAHELGLRFIHQDPAIFPSLTVAENLALGTRFASSGGRTVRWGAERRAARTALAALELPIDPDARTGDLPQAQRTMVAVARALQPARGGGEARLLVLDEPTASLPEHEVEAIFDVVRSVAARGVGIVYVSHRIEELFALTERITVLRDGRLVTTTATRELDEPRLVRLIVGDTLKETFTERAGPPPDGPERLRVEGLRGNRLDGVDLTVRAGEVVGIAGLLGSGRSELARSIFGEQRPRAGRIALDGEEVRFRTPQDAIGAGVALVPEDRRGQSAFAGLTLRENLSIADLAPLTRGGSVAAAAERRETARLIEEFDVRPRMPEKPFGLFSGGNQQKAVLARWMRLSPRVMILDEPTQGIDVNAKAEVFALIRRLSAEGVATLFVSSDFAELEHVCHRVLVLRGGRVAAELTGEQMTSQRIVELAFLDEAPAAQQTPKEIPTP